MSNGQSDLRDANLEDEIELVGELVAATTDSDGPLTQAEIDAALGVRRDADAAAGA